tara:strand:+ start:9645 stop:10688 length:1044 start_codon:yes stop_codon:yes gene_type:complete
MLGTYAYHEIIKRTIIAFGTLFNNLYIKHKDGDGNDHSLMKVPISYGPVQKFLARLDEKPDLRNRVAITLPRMSFEMTNFEYDASRKVSTLQQFQANTGNGPVQVYMPAPYNIGIQLSIITKYQDDMLQIIEQILPYFQPHFNLSVDLVKTIGEKKDIPVILQNITMEDDYEGDYSTRRSLVYTLNFVAKTSIFGRVPEEGDKRIKKVTVDYYTDTSRQDASRQLRYTVQPRALQDYNNDSTTVVEEPIERGDTIIQVNDATSLVVDGYIDINEELMFIKEISGNYLTVLRAQDGTSAGEHGVGDAVSIVNVQDNTQIPYGDPYGFDEDTFDFGDGRVFSPRKDSDL